jgi:hypothetical protein
MSNRCNSLFRLQKKMSDLPDHQQASVFGARCFYFIMYSLFYFCIAYYPNKMRLSFAVLIGNAPAEDLAKTSWVSCLLYCVFYITMHMAAIYFFLTAGDNPGFVAAVRARLSTTEMEPISTND